jgi:methyltransferase (TIGR00027 family)
MKDGQASITARRVAVHRLSFERVPATYGNAEADELLARDVAGDQSVEGSTDGMVRYLAARTAFFDRVVVNAIDGGLRQLVIAAAGYDGRALRYAPPEVRWFEVDHPDTQRDKLDRLQRLHIDANHIRFVAADFADPGLGDALAAAGLDRNEPSLFVCEGVAIYLEPAVLESLLRELRSVAGAGSRLAISLSIHTNEDAESVRREAFRTAVAAMGEPARTVLDPDEVDTLLTSTGWRARPSASERAQRAGLLVLEPA